MPHVAHSTTGVPAASACLNHLHEVTLSGYNHGGSSILVCIQHALMMKANAANDVLRHLPVSRARHEVLSEYADD